MCKFKCFTLISLNIKKKGFLFCYFENKGIMDLPHSQNKTLKDFKSENLVSGCFTKLQNLHKEKSSIPKSFLIGKYQLSFKKDTILSMSPG